MEATDDDVAVTNQGEHDAVTIRTIDPSSAQYLPPVHLRLGGQLSDPVATVQSPL